MFPHLNIDSAYVVSGSFTLLNFKLLCLMFIYLLETISENLRLLSFCYINFLLVAFPVSRPCSSSSSCCCTCLLLILTMEEKDYTPSGHVLSASKVAGMELMAQ